MKFIAFKTWLNEAVKHLPGRTEKELLSSPENEMFNKIKEYAKQNNLKAEMNFDGGEASLYLYDKDIKIIIQEFFVSTPIPKPACFKARIYEKQYGYYVQADSEATHDNYSYMPINFIKFYTFEEFKQKIEKWL